VIGKSDEKSEVNNFCESAGGGRRQNALGAVIDARPLHNYTKPAIMSYRRKPVSGIIKYFLDSGFHRNDE